MIRTFLRLYIIISESVELRGPLFNKVILPFRNVFRFCDSEGQVRSNHLEILFASCNTNDGTGHE